MRRRPPNKEFGENPKQSRCREWRRGRIGHCFLCGKARPRLTHEPEDLPHASIQGGGIYARGRMDAQHHLRVGRKIREKQTTYLEVKYEKEITEPASGSFNGAEPNRARHGGICRRRRAVAELPRQRCEHGHKRGQDSGRRTAHHAQMGKQARNGLVNVARRSDNRGRHARHHGRRYAEHALSRRRQRREVRENAGLLGLRPDCADLCRRNDNRAAFKGYDRGL